MDPFSDDRRRVTFALPLGIDHVHCYLVRGESGAMLLVDTALGLPDAAERWRAELASLQEPVERIVVTHFHPDHVGGAADVAELTGAPVYQGRLDHEHCLRAWDRRESAVAVSRQMVVHGMPEWESEAVLAHHNRLAAHVHFARGPEPLEPGGHVDGWEVLHLPGHADGHLCLLRDGVLVAGDVLLGDITPNVGLYPESRPDPLGDYLASLGRVIELAPELALPGHGEPILAPAARAREIREHHDVRLEATAAALATGPRSAYEVSLTLFPGELPPVLRRFALAESLAHLEYLACRGEVVRLDDGGPKYAATAAAGSARRSS